MLCSWKGCRLIIAQPCPGLIKCVSVPGSHIPQVADRKEVLESIERQLKELEDRSQHEVHMGLKKKAEVGVWVWCELVQVTRVDGIEHTLSTLKQVVDSLSGSCTHHDQALGERATLQQLEVTKQELLNEISTKVCHKSKLCA